MRPLAHRSSFIATAVTATLIALAAPGCGRAGIKDSQEAADAPVAVSTATARAVEISEPLEAGGVVAASATAIITSRVVAPVLEVRVRAGDRVRAGQVLVVLDGGPLAAQAQQAAASVTAAEQALLTARSEHTSAQADQKLAEAWHARIAALHERKAATPQELDEAEGRRASAAGRAAAARARIDYAASQLAVARAAADAARTLHGFTAVEAPFAGLVTERLTDAGNLASPGVPLLRLDAEGAARVEARVDEARARLIAVGDAVEVVFGEREDAPVEGQVVEIARAIHAGDRSFTVKVSVPGEPGARMTGTFARVRFRGPLRHALVVPASAIRRQGQLATALVVDAGVARLRLLQTGVTSGGRVEVVAGLDAGEIVVVDPPASLADGRAVAAGPASAGGEDR